MVEGGTKERKGAQGHKRQSQNAGQAQGVDGIPKGLVNGRHDALNPKPKPN
jgi:hypothetical protein